MSDEPKHPREAQEGQKPYTINVNGRWKDVTTHFLTFQQLVELDAELIRGPNVTYTVTFKRGHGEKPEGTLVEGESVKVKERMIFNVTATDKS